MRVMGRNDLFNIIISVVAVLFIALVVLVFKKRKKLFLFVLIIFGVSLAFFVTVKMLNSHLYKEYPNTIEGAITPEHIDTIGIYFDDAINKINKDAQLITKNEIKISQFDYAYSCDQTNYNIQFAFISHNIGRYETIVEYTNDKLFIEEKKAAPNISYDEYENMPSLQEFEMCLKYLNQSQYMDILSHSVSHISIVYYSMIYAYKAIDMSNNGCYLLDQNGMVKIDIDKNAQVKHGLVFLVMADNEVYMVIVDSPWDS